MHVNKAEYNSQYHTQDNNKRWAEFRKSPPRCFCAKGTCKISLMSIQIR